jgi:SOS-response transcriptional repressor LexA
MGGDAEKTNLTTAQRDMLRWLRRWAARHGRAPTEDEIMDGLSIVSGPGLEKRLGPLFRRGLIARDGTGRGVVVVEGPAGETDEKTSTGGG